MLDRWELATIRVVAGCPRVKPAVQAFLIGTSRVAFPAAFAGLGICHLAACNRTGRSERWFKGRYV
jgi:hypothetical protein